MQEEGRNKMNRFQTTCRAGGNLGVSETKGGGAEQGGHSDFQLGQSRWSSHLTRCRVHGGGGRGRREEQVKAVHSANSCRTLLRIRPASRSWGQGGNKEKSLLPQVYIAMGNMRQNAKHMLCGDL